MPRRMIARRALGTLTELGQGARGIFYRVTNAKIEFGATMVFKEYEPEARSYIDFAALATMPNLVEKSLSYEDGQGLFSIAGWPCGIIEIGSVPVGFVMPAIPDSFFIDIPTADGAERTPAEFAHLIDSPAALAARGINITDLQQQQLLREVAKALTFLHRLGVCAGDISPENLLIGLHPRPAVYFIQCDLMRVNGASAQPQTETSGWEVPVGEELGTVHSDSYKLGLLALRLLTGDQSTRNVQQLLPTTPTLLRQLITDSLTREPDRRPRPETWTNILREVIQNPHLNGPDTHAPTGPSAYASNTQTIVRSQASDMPSTRKPFASNARKWTAPTYAETSAAQSLSEISRRRVILAFVALATMFVLGIGALSGEPLQSGSTAAQNSTSTTSEGSTPPSSAPMGTYGNSSRVHPSNALPQHY